MSSDKPSIHWIGAGLASGPGLVSLANKWGEATVWDMTLDRAKFLSEQVNDGAKLNVAELNLRDDASLQNFKDTLNKGDIVISMLPATFHVEVANVALECGCHLVTSSYLSEDMIALNEKAKDQGLVFINEVGLDPGIDHLLTHILVDEAKKADVLGKGKKVDFVSYCGGFPAEPTPFTYKFSWTPLGVLTALTNQAQLVQGGEETTINKAWTNVSEIAIHGETFEAYANRNSLPYIAEYGLGDETNLNTFVRGTLRMGGWKTAWKDIFDTIENASMDDLKALSDQLWNDHQYGEDEEDRVVLYVALTADDWHGSMTVDAKGTGWQSAMADTVSYTVAEAVSAIIENRLDAGVQAAPHGIAEAKLWLDGLKANGIEVKCENVSL